MLSVRKLEGSTGIKACSCGVEVLAWLVQNRSRIAHTPFARPLPGITTTLGKGAATVVRCDKCQKHMGNANQHACATSAPLVLSVEAYGILYLIPRAVIAT